MISKHNWILLALVSSGFCVNEYLPIEPGKTEADAGYSFQMAYGQYDTSGKEKSLPSGVSPINNLIPLQVKYGILSGLDAELAWTGAISNSDYGGGTALAGLMNPDLAVKYSPIEGVAGYLDLALPFATGNLDHPKPDWGLGLGAVFGKRFGNFRAVATGSYLFNFENGDNVQDGNKLDLYFKPEAMWTEFIGTYLGIKFDWTGDTKISGTTMPNSGPYALALIPGLNTKLLNWLAYEVNVPVTVFGKNGPATWGVAGSVYATFPM